MNAKTRSILHVMRLGLLAGGGLLVITQANAATTCSFTTVGTVMTLDSDCTTDTTILVPNGFTLNGNDYTITAVDPSGGHFTGAIVANAGVTAHVMNLIIDTSALANACDSGADRLRGIMFEGASGTITKNTVKNINQGPSGCQEGNAIEVRNTPFDGTHPATKSVTVTHNVVTDYQKSGVVANGDVFVTLLHNKIGASATQATLAANSVQYGFGGQGIAQFNDIAGNEWLGASDYAASAVLLYQAGGAIVSKNNIGGNAEVGLWVEADGATVDNNRVFDEGPDLATHGYDIGVGNYGDGNTITNNKVRGYDTPYEGVTGGKNKVIPGKGGQKANPSF